MTLTQLDSILTKIAVMDRLELLQEIRAFRDPFQLDFSDEYMAAQETERLRHILMAAYLQRKSCSRDLEPVA